MSIGIDQNRVSLLLAVLEKRAGLSLAGDDVYVNIAGGMNIEEPAADLSVVAAVASSVRNRSLPSSTAIFGEVGLSGEIRGIPQAALRVREAAQMGFDASGHAGRQRRLGTPRPRRTAAIWWVSGRWARRSISSLLDFLRGGSKVPHS